MPYRRASLTRTFPPTSCTCLPRNTSLRPAMARIPSMEYEAVIGGAGRASWILRGRLATMWSGGSIVTAPGEHGACTVNGDALRPRSASSIPPVSTPRRIRYHRLISPARLSAASLFPNFTGQLQLRLQAAPSTHGSWSCRPAHVHGMGFRALLVGKAAGSHTVPAATSPHRLFEAIGAEGTAITVHVTPRDTHARLRVSPLSAFPAGRAGIARDGGRRHWRSMS
ncbi:hypothetical protein C8J57DRAFT_148832 [Mycena rebaudengoi]|nr:hypothetical protein C8J57DRAFT_148832 [Mycena rebaudengoi]